MPVTTSSTLLEVPAKPLRPPDITVMKPKSLSLDLEKPPDAPRRSMVDSPVTPTEPLRPIRRSTRTSSAVSLSDTKVFVVWLESYEDHENFPTGNYFHYL